MRKGDEKDSGWSLSGLDSSSLPGGLGSPARTVLGRYQSLELLGQGGMGRVFKAWDPQLERFVALKVLREDEPGLLSRFLAEARAQARINHENVCKVYEARFEGNEPFIAMELLEGGGLDDASRWMTLDQKVAVVRDIALGIHAAHQTGLIHRDLKPANVLLCGRDGPLKPCVVDFGLARDLSQPRLTRDDQIVGTPVYMAPEQVRGDPACIDRRTDVYGLGTILYELLTGQPPFDSERQIEVLFDVLEKEPEAPGKLVPSLPRDLERVVLKCMEKEPLRRYESALALAEDLGRYLRGDPVLADRGSRLYKLRKLARKNRVAAGVLAVSSVIAVASAWVAVSAQWQATEQARLAQEFTAEVEEMAGLLRAEHLSPPHDIRPVRQLVRELTQQIESRIRVLGPVARAPGAFALGRAYLTLEEYEKALDSLRAAWELGSGWGPFRRPFRSPELAYYIGLCYGRLYEEALEAAASVTDNQRRATLIHKAEKSLRGPAVGFLRRSRGAALLMPEYPEALIDYYEKRYDQALEKARKAASRGAWYYEARILEGEILIAKGNVKRDLGDLQAASKEYEAATGLLEKAVRIGESDPYGYRSLCFAHTSHLRLVAHGSGGDTAPFLRGAEEACGQALGIDPQDRISRRILTNAYIVAARRFLEQGKDPGATLQLALRSAEKGIEIDPASGYSWRNLGGAWLALGEWRFSSNQPAGEAFRNAKAAFEKGTQFEGLAVENWNGLGVINWWLAHVERGKGGESRHLLEAAARCFREALIISPSELYASTNLTGVLGELANDDALRGRDPRLLYEEAAVTCTRALASNPNAPFTLDTLGRVLTFRAGWEMKNGIDPSPTLAQAEASFKKALEIKPDHLLSRVNLGNANLVRAEFLLARGLDPVPELDMARTLVMPLLKESSFPGETSGLLAATALVEAEWNLLSGMPAGGALTMARVRTGQALNSGLVEDWEPLELLSRLEMLAVWQQIKERKSPSRQASIARKVIERGLQKRPQNQVFRLHRGLVEFLDAITTGSREGIHAGIESLDEVLKVNSMEAEAYLTKAFLLKLESRLEKNDQVLSEGKEAEAKALQLNSLLESKARAFQSLLDRG